MCSGFALHLWSASFCAPAGWPVRRIIREHIPHNGCLIPRGLQFYLSNSGALNTTDMGRMLNQDSRQPLRFHAGADGTLASQLSAERMVRKNRNLVWVREHKDNHLLDCLVLSAAAADAPWRPSLPHYILQLQSQARMQNEKPRPKQRNARSQKLRAQIVTEGTMAFTTTGGHTSNASAMRCGTGADALRPARDRGRPALLGKKRAALRGTVRPARRQNRRPLVCRRSPPAGVADETAKNI